MIRKPVVAIMYFFVLILSGCAGTGLHGRENPENRLKDRILLPEMNVARGEKQGAFYKAVPIPKRPISLQEAIEIALKNNHALRRALEDVDIAAADKNIARSLFLPGITAGWAYDWSDRQRAMVNPKNPLMPPMYAGEKEFRRAEIKLMMTIWDFGRSLGAYNQAKLGHEIAGLLYERARQQVILNVVSAYYDLLRAQRGKIIAEESLVQAKEHLRTATVFEKYGVVDMNDVLRAKVQVAEVSQMLIKARNGVELATSKLNSVLGINVNSPTRVVDNTTIVPFSLSLRDCLELAVEHRPEFEVVQNAIRVEEEGIRTARAGHLPRIYVAGNYAWNDDDYQKFADSSGGLHDNNISAEIGIQIELFGGGRTTAEVRKAKKKLAKANEKAKEMCDGISLQVKSAFLDVHEARERIKVTKEAVAQAKENLRLMNNKYRESVVTSIDVVDAETLLTRSKQNYYTALYDYIVALARLENAIGTSSKRIEATQ
ncbi:MAG: TolC family protein [Deltaproteobacteria bacterium]|nr:TolC family protein [Deltaproteobacteria bacterium]MBW2298831.1 TolC family protein [Deltaproteobacteria bacterium]